MAVMVSSMFQMMQGLLAHNSQQVVNTLKTPSQVITWMKFDHLHSHILMKDLSSIWSEMLQIYVLYRIMWVVEFSFLHATCDDDVSHTQYIASIINANTKKPAKVTTPLPTTHPAQWQSAVKQPKNSVCCITSFMLSKWPQRCSAGGEVKQDHLLLFLKKLPA